MVRKTAAARAERGATSDRRTQYSTRSLGLLAPLAAALAFAACGDTPSAPAGLRALHSFGGGDGAWSRGSLVASGARLYGRTSLGGAAGSGVIFAIDDDGGDFALLYSFPAGGDNGVGNEPHHNSMLLRGDLLIGAALYGGQTGGANAAALDVPTPPTYPKLGQGTIFQITTAGRDYGVLLEMGGGDSRSELPHSPPMLAPDGTTLYGMTSNGGANQSGTLYAMRVDGSGYAVLHSFETATGDEPHGVVSLDTSGRRLLGMTRHGGPLANASSDAKPAGVVFRYDLDTGAYEILHTFASNSATNGATNDHGFLTRVGGDLYATTERGGESDQGTIFRIGEDGTGFSVVHSFAGGASDGARPFGSLVAVGNWLYGTTPQGGATGDGTLFRFLPPDGPLEVLASFDRATVGAFPEDNVTLAADGRALIGLTQAGGENDPTASLYYGTVFSFTLPREG